MLKPYASAIDLQALNTDANTPQFAGLLDPCKWTSQTPMQITALGTCNWSIFLTVQNTTFNRTLKNSKKLMQYCANLSHHPGATSCNSQCPDHTQLSFIIIEKS